MSDWLPPIDGVPLVIDEAIGPIDSSGSKRGGFGARLASRILDGGGGSKTKHKTINRNRVENHYYGGHDDYVGLQLGPLYAGAFPRKKRRRR